MPRGNECHRHQPFRSSSTGRPNSSWIIGGAVITAALAVAAPNPVLATPDPQARSMPQVGPVPQGVVQTRGRADAAKRVQMLGSTSTSPVKKCRDNEDTYRVLRLAAVEDGVRVDYEFMVSGRATWTNMNRPMLKEFGVRAGGTFCLPRNTISAEAEDYD